MTFHSGENRHFLVGIDTGQRRICDTFAVLYSPRLHYRRNERIAGDGYAYHVLRHALMSGSSNSEGEIV